MRFISCHDGKLQTLETAGLKTSRDNAFVTGLVELDALAPQQSLARGAVHELLFDAADGQPKFVAALLACAAALLPLPGTPGRGLGRGASDAWSGAAVDRQFLHLQDRPLPQLHAHPTPLPCPLPGVPGRGSMPVIWSDPRGEIYPPALAALGFDLAQTYLLRTNSDEDESWAVAECLRCRGVGAVIAAPSPARAMTRTEARRLQLAAERGGSVGILLRQTGRGDHVYAAATRWKISPLVGERTVQRWTIQLLHGHGGRVGNTVILEWCREREKHSVRAVEKLADRPAAPKAAERATA